MDAVIPARTLACAAVICQACHGYLPPAQTRRGVCRDRAACAARRAAVLGLVETEEERAA